MMALESREGHIVNFVPFALEQKANRIISRLYPNSTTKLGSDILYRFIFDLVRTDVNKIKLRVRKNAANVQNAQLTDLDYKVDG